MTPSPGLVEEARATGAVTAAEQEAYVRINSIGAVVIGDDVEVGANTCIDRGTVADTTIGDGTKIDNQVQIGHNVRIGSTCLVCGQAGIAGSSGDRRPRGARRARGGRGPPAHRLERGHCRQYRRDRPRGEQQDHDGLSGGANAQLFVEMYKALRRLPRVLARLEAAQKPVSKPDASD